ncbi:MAG: outer membrane protein assembly factor BamB family protein [Planctomycetota bacterium]|jgi:outer membrane protein assembly factor BamB
MRRDILLVVALLVLASPLAAQHRRKKAPKVDPELLKIVEPLIKDLDDPSFGVREDATQKLMQLGPEARPALLPAKDHSSPEVRMRVRRVLLYFQELLRRESLEEIPAGDWPMLKRGPSRGASSGPAIRTAPDVHWYRMLPLILGKPYLDAPLVAGRDRLYAVTRAGQVAAVDRETGKILWVRETGERVFAGPVLAGGRLYVPGSSLTAMHAGTGDVLWRWKTDYGVIASPLVHDGAVYAVEKGEKLAALDPDTGEETWKVRLRATSSAPVLAGKLLVIGTEDGVMAVRPGGMRRWTAETDQPVTITPAVLRDRVVVGDLGRTVYALTSDRGKTVWKRRIPEGRILLTPTVYGDAILFSTSGATFRAIHAADGSDLWTRWIGTVIQSSPCVAGGVAYLVAGSRIRALECVNGDDVWLLDLMGNYASPILVEGSLFLLAFDGGLLSLR